MVQVSNNSIFMTFNLVTLGGFSCMPMAVRRGISLPKSIADAFTDTGSLSTGCFAAGICWVRVASHVFHVDIFVVVVLAHAGIALFLVFSTFTVMVTNKNVSRALSGKNYKDLFKLGDYSHWLQKYVVNAENREEIKSCLVDTEYCRRLPTGKGVDFYKYSLSAMESSCCKPPTYCGLEFHSAADWTMPKTEPVVPDNDCKIWSNVQTELCFNCQSCKTAFLDNIKKDWKQLSLINLGLFLLVLVVFCFGCCALRNNGSKEYSIKQNQPRGIKIAPNPFQPVLLFL